MTDFRTLCEQAGITPARLAQLAGRTARTGVDWTSGRVAIPEPIMAWLQRRIADPVPRLDAYQPVPPSRLTRAQCAV